MKGFHLKLVGQERKEQLGEMAHHLQEALPAIPLTQNQVLSTAYANDVEPDMIFAQQVYGYGQDGDVLIALTTSDSKNVFCAAEVAVKKHMKVIGFTGAGGGRLKEVAEHPYLRTGDGNCIYSGKTHYRISHAVFDAGNIFFW